MIALLSFTLPFSPARESYQYPVLFFLILPEISMRRNEDARNNRVRMSSKFANAQSKFHTVIRTIRSTPSLDHTLPRILSLRTINPERNNSLFTTPMNFGVYRAAITIQLAQTTSSRSFVRCQFACHSRGGKALSGDDFVCLNLNKRFIDHCAEKRPN